MNADATRIEEMICDNTLPGPLPSKGETFAAFLEGRAKGLAGWFSANRKTADSYSFSFGGEGWDEGER